MKRDWIKVIGVLSILAWDGALYALPAVESRTGSPVVKTRREPLPYTMEERVAQLTLNQIEALQKEVSELRGLVETQEHETQQLKKSQQDLYLDLDRRLTELKKDSGSIPAPVTVSSQKPLLPTTPIMSTAKSGVASKLKTSQPVVTPLSHPSSGETETYQAAYDLVKTKKYPEAVLALQNYLRHFPKGEHAGHAHYWLGEVLMVQWQSDKKNSALADKAMAQFSSISAEFPNHPKVMNAILKLGLIELDKGNKEAGISYLKEVKSRFPGTAAARIAETRLKSE